jgi:uncharacterized protein (DUF885 family)
VGDLRIQAARKRAEKALGKTFDIRGFHEQVLMTGALPLEVLDRTALQYEIEHVAGD